jgi:long-chain acyl-CoA synthetase
MRFRVFGYNFWRPMLRPQLYADPNNLFLHDVILSSCRRHGRRLALVDSSCGRRITYSEYGDLLESAARGFLAAGIKPGEVVAIFLANCWEFCIAYHAITLAGGVPTLLNPTYRQREVHYQLENSKAVALISDGSALRGTDLSGLPDLRRVYATRQPATGAECFASLLKPASVRTLKPEQPPEQTLAALPYSSGTTGLPKGVMLSHFNLVANVYQALAKRTIELTTEECILCFLPLYHIYGLNVILNPVLTAGATLVLLPRFHVQPLWSLIVGEGVTMMPMVPPAMIALCEAAEKNQFPRDHKLAWVKCGAAPLPPELPRRFTTLTGIPVVQGYGMTEASPLTHIGYLDADLYCPDSIGHPVAQTDCRVLSQTESDATDDPEKMTEARAGEAGELVMRGPQFMLGYWKEPKATAAVLRDGWFWSGDIVTRDDRGFYRIVDRRKEMIKYKGFPVAPAEVEAVLLEHPAVRECGVVGRADAVAGEIPVAFVALRDGFSTGAKLADELCAFVADRLTHYKQPRQVHFVDFVPQTASGKILRRELRKHMH